MKKIVLKIIKWIFILLGFGIFLLCLVPMGQRIINIGNVFGVVYFGGLTAILLTTHFWIPKVRSFWKKTSGKWILSVCGGIVAAGTLYMIVIGGVMIGAAITTPNESATVVVLGCKVNGEQPSLMLQCRLEAAYDYLNTHPSAKCIVSGGQGYNEGISEAECMYRWLVDKGIDKKRLYREDRSTTTEENIRYSGEIITQNGLNSDLALVTDGFHEFRASIIARKQSYTCGSVPANTPFYLLPTYVFREMFGIAKELLF